MGKAKRRDKNKTAKAAARAEPPSLPGIKGWHVLAGLAVALFAVFEVYQPAINGPFLFDDKYLAFTHPDYQNMDLAGWLGGGRKLLMFSYWMNYQTSGQEPYAYHLLNLLFHFAAGVLVFLIVRKLLERVGVESWPREPVAAFAGALFLLHPLHTEAVAYVASRSENLSVMLAYGALAVFLYRGSGGVGWLRAIAVVTLYGGAVLTKEHTAVLPALLLLTDYYFFPGFSLSGIKGNWRLYVPIVVGGVAGVAFVWRILSMSDTAGFSVEGLPWYLYFFTQCQAIWIYVRMFFLPYELNVDHDYPMVETMADPLAIAGLVALLALAGAAWWYRKRYPLISYGVLVFLLFLAPTSSFVPIQDTLVERRAYLPSLGLLLIVADLVRRWRPSRAALAGAMAAVLLVIAFAGNQRAQAWESPLTLWEDSVAKNPRNWRANFQLAYAHYERQECTQAAELYANAAELAEPDYRLLVDWAHAYDCAGKLDEAVVKLREAAALENSAHVQTEIGMILAKQQRHVEALAALGEAEKLQPRYEMIYFNRGNVYRAMGDAARAALEYRRALELKSSLDAARRGLAWAEQSLQQSP
ncbi:MAG: hypothetical protein GY953_06345 [bacterium]|nr:hypothetical protein [bacterium]